MLTHSNAALSQIQQEISEYNGLLTAICHDKAVQILDMKSMYIIVIPGLKKRVCFFL